MLFYTDDTMTTPIDASNYDNNDTIYCNFSANGYRLPTEGEWEYFCSAGTTGVFWVGEPNYTSSICGSPFCVEGEFPYLEQVAVFCDIYPGGTVVVGSKDENPWGLRDVHGNVYDWCWDWYSSSYPSGSEKDYAGPGSGSLRVIRGGYWGYYARYCRSAIRYGYWPYNRGSLIGFRLLRSVGCIPGELWGTDSIVGDLYFMPAGTLVQGSPTDEPCRNINESQFTHTLTRNQAVMSTEVTRQMWADLKAVQTSLPNDPTDTGCGSGMTNPVQNITWYEAVLFANLLSVEQGFTQCYYTDDTMTTPIDASNFDNNDTIYCHFNADGYRLPMEGEWEYFCRAGTTRPFWVDEPNYNSSNCSDWITTPGTWPYLEEAAWFCANIYDPAGNNTTKPVGLKEANPWGLRDVHGNVFEWCWDWYGLYPSGNAIDYEGPGSGSVRAYRSGSWNYFAYICRSAGRDGNSPGLPSSLLGFRLLRSLPEC